MKIWYSGKLREQHKPNWRRENNWLSWPAGVNVDTSLATGIITVEIVWDQIVGVEKHDGQTNIFIKNWNGYFVIQRNERRPYITFKRLKAKKEK